MVNINVNQFSIEKLLEKINDKIPYIDRVHVWFNKNIPKLNLNLLNKTAGSIKIRKGVMTYQDKNGTWYKNWSGTYKLEILQPTRKTFKYLEEINTQPDNHFVNYIEFALDFITKTKEDAVEVQNFFDNCWLKRWHGKQKTLNTRGTSYSGQRATTNFVTYSNRLSKVNKLPCCHLEVRLSTKAACKNAGYGAFNDFLDCNFNSFWEKYLVLREVRDETWIKKVFESKYGRAIQGRLNNKNRYPNLEAFDDYIDYYMNYFIRLVKNDYPEGKITSQKVQDKWKPINNRCLKKIPNNQFLPKA